MNCMSQFTSHSWSFVILCLRKHSSLILPFYLYCAVEIFIMIFIFTPLEHIIKANEK